MNLVTDLKISKIENINFLTKNGDNEKLRSRKNFPK